MTLLSNIHFGFGHEVTFLILPDSFSSPLMQTYIGKGPPLIISYYFPSSFNMFLLCGALPIWQKPNGRKEEDTLIGNLFQQHGSPTLSSTGVCLLPKIMPAACYVKHRELAAAFASALANSGGHGCTSRGERQGKGTPIYLSVHIKRFLHQLQRYASQTLMKV